MARSGLSATKWINSRLAPRGLRRLAQASVLGGTPQPFHHMLPVPVKCGWRGPNDARRQTRRRVKQKPGISMPGFLLVVCQSQVQVTSGWRLRSLARHDGSCDLCSEYIQTATPRNAKSVYGCYSLSGLVYLIRKLSRFAPSASAAASQRGALPRPLQVSPVSG